MEESTLSNDGESSPTHAEGGVSKLEGISQTGSSRVGVWKKLEHRRSRIQKSSHAGGGNGRTFDLENIASGSNGSHVTNTDRACRVTVTIIAAKDLKRTTPGPDARDPVLKVRVEQTLKKSKDIRTGVHQVLMDLLVSTQYLLLESLV